MYYTFMQFSYPTDMLTRYSTNFKKFQGPSSMYGMHRVHGENRLDPVSVAELFNSRMKHRENRNACCTNISWFMLLLSNSNWIFNSGTSTSPFFHQIPWTPNYFYTGWWFEPLWKIWVRQLGWWHSQYIGKTCSKPPTISIASSTRGNRPQLSPGAAALPWKMQRRWGFAPRRPDVSWNKLNHGTTDFEPLN